MEREKDQVPRDADAVIRNYYEQDIEGAFREDVTEPVSSVRATGKGGHSAELSGGDMDAASEQSDDGTETVGGSNPTPDQDIVDEIGKAAGLEYQDNEPLKFGEKMAQRDEHRWELDPASSEDYQVRTKGLENTPSQETSPTPPSPQLAKKSQPRTSRSSRQPRSPKSR